MSIAGQSVTATKGTGNSYTATYTVVAAQVAGSDGMVASYDIGAMTAAGNPANALDPDAADSTIRIDVTAPVIDLNGGDVTLTVGDTYTEQGASATDNLDASVDVVTGGATVDTQAADTYTLTYDATDAAGNEAMQVERTVTVNPVPNTAPSIQGRAAVDYAENGAGSVATYTATDVESNAITWSLGGTDADQLSIGATSGVLTFRSAPDYETKSTYSSVHATETNGVPSNLTDELAVTITITNVDEDGAISAIRAARRSGRP